MNKKGFVFLETIVVLVIVVMSLTVLLSSYFLITRKVNARLYYDQSSDKYLLNAIIDMGSGKNANNYENSFKLITSENCSESDTKLKVKSDTMCSNVFSQLGLIKLYITGDITKMLKNNKSSLDNGTIDFVKTLKKCKSDLVDGECDGENINYAVGVFNRQGHYYYASIKLGG